MRELTYVNFWKVRCTTIKGLREQNFNYMSFNIPNFLEGKMWVREGNV